MSSHLIIGVLDGEITDVTTVWMNSEVMEIHFPVGEVYRQAVETKGGDVLWRVLQRGSEWTRLENGHKSRMSPMLLPLKEEDVPEIVRMVALMHE